MQSNLSPEILEIMAIFREMKSGKPMVEEYHRPRDMDEWEYAKEQQWQSWARDW